MSERAPVAVVTGGSTGLGQTIASTLAGQGYTVVTADISAPTASSPSVLWRALDVTDNHQVNSVMDDVVTELGGIDVLVNNAGIQRHRSLEALTWQEWTSVLDVNLNGVFSCLQAAGRHMLTAGTGAIINIASISARGSAGRAPYATSKAAVIALTATAGAEWASRGVRVNAVAPGYVDTGVFRQGVAAGTLDPDRVLSRIPAGTLAEPQDVADAVVFLSSEKSKYIFGQTLFVDGGFSVDYGVPLKLPAT